MAQRFFQNGEVIQSTDPRVYEGDVLSLGVLLMELFNYYYAYFENSECICPSDECYFFVSQLVCLATAKYSFVYFSKHYFCQMVKYVGFLSLVTVFELCMLTTASYPGPIAAAQ